MKVIDAVWEKANLGVTSVEIEIEAEDEACAFRKVDEELHAEYRVVKVPSYKEQFVSTVQELGYRYVEDMILVSHDLHEVSRNRILQRLYDACSYRKMTDEDIEQLFQELNEGIMDHDRISNDKNFAAGCSKQRYINWTRDLLKQGAVPYVILYKESSAGFVILKTRDGIEYQSVLGGAYKEFRNRGTGVVQKEQEIVKSLGGRRVTTAVSSNNISQVKALIENGYVPYGINHIFVKHI